MARINTKRKGSGKKSYSIIVDGQNEIWYLQLMKQHEKLPRIDLQPELPKKKKLRELFDLGKSNAQIYDKVIWLLDLDVIVRDNQIEEFKKYVKLLHKNDRVIILVNNPCLEFWYLLHFKRYGKTFSRCDEVVKELVKCR